MPTLRVMSWNVQSLGEAKSEILVAGAREIVNFVSRSIAAADATIAGIMEIKSGYGPQLGPWLSAALNNLQGINEWNWFASQRQDGRPNEEYLLLWREQPGTLSLNLQARPMGAWLIGVFDPGALVNLPPSTPAVDPAALVQALIDSAYLMHGQFMSGGSRRSTATLRINPERWQELVVGEAIDLPRGPALTPAQEQWLSSVLVSFDIFRFLTYGDRPPFVANFLLGAAQHPVTLVLFHAEGPGANVGSAVNLLADTAPVSSAGALVLTGDFNVTSTRPVPVPVHSRNGPVARSSANTYAPFGALGLEAPLGNTLTTLQQYFYADPTSAGVPLTSLEVRHNDYDKFFLRRTAAVAPTANTGVFDLVASTAGNQPALTFSAALGASSLALYRAGVNTGSIDRKLGKFTASAATLTKQRARAAAAAAAAAPTPAAAGKRKLSADSAVAGDDDKLAEAQEQRASLTALRAVVTDPASAHPPNVGTAAAIYRRIISDHLPIVVELQFP